MYGVPIGPPSAESEARSRELYGQTLGQLEMGYRDRQAYQQQRAALAAQRQAGADQFGYEYALGQQKYGWDAYRQQAQFLHDDELFERHEAGRIAEMQLQQEHQQRQLQQQAGIQEQRDYRQAGFEQERLGQQADIQTGRDVFQAGEQERRDVYQAGIAREHQGQEQMARATETGFQAGQLQQRQEGEQAFRAGEQRQQQEATAGLQGQRQVFEYNEATERMMHATVLADVAQRGRESEAEILRKSRAGELSMEYRWKADLIEQQYQEKEDQDTIKGLASGEYRLPKGVKEMLDANEEHLARIEASDGVSDADKENLNAQIMAKSARLRRLRTAVPPEEKAKASGLRKQQLIQELPSEHQGRPWQYNAKLDMLVDPKIKAEELGPVTEEESADLDELLPPALKNSPKVRTKGGSVAVHPDFYKWKMEEMKGENKKEISTERQEASAKEAQLARDAVYGRFKEARGLTEDQFEDNKRELNRLRMQRRNQLEKEIEAANPDVPNVEGGWLSSSTRKMKPTEKVARVKEQLDKEQPEYTKTWKEYQREKGQGQEQQQGVPVSRSGKYKWDGTEWVPK